MKLIDIHHSGQQCFLAIGIIIIVLWLGGESTTTLLEYQRIKIEEGEVWRLITGHIVHTNSWHMFLNLTSLLFIGVLFGTLLNGTTWAIAFLFCALVVSAGYWYISPEYIVYVGLSATLYGVIIIGAIQDIKQNTLIASLLILIVTGRVIWQQFDGASDSLAELVDSRVAIESHLYGIMGGYIYSLLYYFVNLRSDRGASDTHSN